MNTIYELIKKSAANNPEITAVCWPVKREVLGKTYEQLLTDIHKVVLLLEKENLTGKHVAVLGASSYQWIVTYLGVVASGSVALPLDAGLGDDDLLDLLTRGDVDGFFVDSARESLVNTWKAQHTEGVSYYLNNLQVVLDEMVIPEGWEEKFALTEKNIDPNNTCTIMFTSGTTGKSKGVMLSQTNLVENVENVRVEVDPGMIMLSVLPMHHAYCLTNDVLQGLVHGVTLALNDSLLHMMKNIKKFQPHIMLMVPLMLETIAKRLKEIDPALPKEAVKQQIFGSNLTMVYSGGAALAPEYIDIFDSFGVEIFQGYGMSECSPVISTNGQFWNRPGSVGKPLPNCEVRIVNEEIQVRGSSVMSGYYKMPKETAEALQDGWLLTGDLGRLDEDGYLYITGRKKNLIILSNGENISPEEFENKLILDDLVGEIVVTGNGNFLTAHIFPDPEYIEKNQLDAETIESRLKELLDRFNETQPTYRRLIGLDIRTQEFEKSSTKKIKRNLVH